MKAISLLKYLKSYSPALVLASMTMIVLAVPVSAQEISVPIRTQVPLFKTLLSFERNHAAAKGEAIRIAVVYQSKFRKSLAAQEEINYFMKENNGSNTISFQMIDIDNDGAEEMLSSQQPLTAFLICPLRSVDIGMVTEISRERKVITMTLVPDYVKKGVSVGIDLNGDKPLILINLNSAKLENADFDSRLLRLAKIVEGENN